MKKIFMVLLCLFFASVLFIMLRSEKEGTENLKIKNKSFIEGLTIHHQVDGTTLWTLTAKRADIAENENMADLSDITVVVQKNGMILHANKGTYDLTARNFTINSEIQADTKDYKIVTSSINYDASTGEIKTDERVTAEGKRFKIEGKGMTLDSEQRVKVQKDVKATFHYNK